MKKEIINFYDKIKDKINNNDILNQLETLNYYLRENNLYLLSKTWSEEKQCYIMLLSDYGYVGEAGYIEIYSNCIYIKHIKSKLIDSELVNAFNEIKVSKNDIEGHVTDIIELVDGYAISKTVFNQKEISNESITKEYSKNSSCEKLKEVIDENQKLSFNIALENNGIYKSKNAFDFIVNNNIKIENIQKTILDLEDINEIINDHCVSSNDGEIEYVCIKDILGFEYSNYRSSQLYENFCRYFDDNSNQYSTRANGMLYYSVNDMVDKLKNTFLHEPIKVLNVENNKCIIDGNGNHRYFLLTICYLTELEKCKSVEEIENLNKKYTIPVKMWKTDIFKTYCRYLLNIYNINSIRGSITIQSNNQDSSIITENFKRFTISDDELLEYVILNTKKDLIESDEVKRYISEYPSFNQFMLNYNLKKEEMYLEKKL